MRIAITLLAIFMVAAVAFGGYGDGSYKSSGTLSGVTIGMSEADPGEEGTTFSVSARSIAPHDHAIKVTGDYAAGPWSEVGDSVFVVKYFAQTTGSNSISISRDLGITLFQGDTLTVTVTVAPTLAAVPDSSVTLDTVSQQYIIDHGVETWVFAPSWLAASTHSEYPTQIDHDLQDSGDGVLWRYGDARNAAEDGWGVDYSSSEVRLRTVTGEPINAAGNMGRLFFMPALDSIPDGCEIVSAKIGAYCLLTEDMSGAGGGFYVSADTNSVDLANMLACEARVGNDQLVQSTWNGPCGVDPDSTNWKGGTFGARPYYHDYGITVYDDVDATTSGAEFTVDITDLVQMHREVGLGMVPLWLFVQGDFAGSNFPVKIGPTATAAENPFIVVRAKPNKQYANIWGDGVIVPLAFSSDDQYAGSNIQWNAVMNEQADTDITIFVRGDAYGDISYAPENKLTTAQLDSLNAAGADVLGHSLYHGGDVNSYDPNCGSYSFISDWTTGVPGDSLYDDLSHTWLSTIIGETVTGMAWPRHIYSLNLWEYARDSGMLWARDGTNEQFGDCAAVTTAGVDAGEPTYVRTDGTPVAMYALKLDAEGSPGWYAPWDNGAAADAVPVDSTTIAERIRFCIGRATWQGRRPVMLFTHDIRGGNYTAAEGLSPGELEDMIQATPSGAQWMTMSDIMTKFIAGSVACDPPTGSASETYGHTAADAVWRKVQ